MAAGTSRERERVRLGLSNVKLRASTDRHNGNKSSERSLLRPSSFVPAIEEKRGSFRPRPRPYKCDIENGSYYSLLCWPDRQTNLSEIESSRPCWNSGPLLIIPSWSKWRSSPEGKKPKVGPFAGLYGRYGIILPGNMRRDGRGIRNGSASDVWSAATACLMMIGAPGSTSGAKASNWGPLQPAPTKWEHL